MDNTDLSLWRRGSRFYVRYDAGAHQVVMREDEISEQEAHQIMRGMAEATVVLFALQKRLQDAGVNPYLSNL